MTDYMKINDQLAGIQEILSDLSAEIGADASDDLKNGNNDMHQYSLKVTVSSILSNAASLIDNAQMGANELSNNGVEYDG